jgi:hypothetical protein
MMASSPLKRWELDLLLTALNENNEPGYLEDIVDPAPTKIADMKKFHLKEYYMDLPLTRQRRAGPYSKTPRVYHWVRYEKGIVYVQYWFFMTFSCLPAEGGEIYNGIKTGGMLWHEGDWEMFQVTIELDDNPRLEPLACTASQHYYGQTLQWAQEGDGPEKRVEDSGRLHDWQGGSLCEGSPRGDRKLVRIDNSSRERACGPIQEGHDSEL